MLKAMGQPLPKQVLVHGWWQKDGQKMSKTTGNVVDPLAVIEEWGLDAFRYYVIRELAIGPDGNWTDTGFQSRYGSELANGLGNLLNRSLSMLKRYRNGVVPSGTNQLAAETATCRERTIAAYQANDPQEALIQIGQLITRSNQYIDQTAPFKLARDPLRAAELDQILYTLTDVSRVLGNLLWPVVPATAEKIQKQLGFATPVTTLTATDTPIAVGQVIGEIFALFPRKDQPPAAGVKK
jgi:methionyl-tRNA synthetase